MSLFGPFTDYEWQRYAHRQRVVPMLANGMRYLLLRSALKSGFTENVEQGPALKTTLDEKHHRIFQVHERLFPVPALRTHV